MVCLDNSPGLLDIDYRDKEFFVRLYKCYVRPILEYAVQAWSPYLVQDVEKLEKVQMRAIKMVSGLNSRDYEGRLRECGITSLVDRRVRVI